MSLKRDNAKNRSILIVHSLGHQLHRPIDFWLVPSNYILHFQRSKIYVRLNPVDLRYTLTTELGIYREVIKSMVKHSSCNSFSNPNRISIEKTIYWAIHFEKSRLYLRNNKDSRTFRSIRVKLCYGFRVLKYNLSGILISHRWYYVLQAINSISVQK